MFAHMAFTMAEGPPTCRLWVSQKLNTSSISTSLTNLITRLLRRGMGQSTMSKGDNSLHNLFNKMLNKSQTFTAMK
jgi:hypothetical protein